MLHAAYWRVSVVIRNKRRNWLVWWGQMFSLISWDKSSAWSLSHLPGTQMAQGCSMRRKQPNGGSWVKFCCSSLANISNIWEMFKSCLFHVGLSIIWGWYLLQAPLVSLFVHVQVSVMRAPLEPFTHQPNHRPTGIVWAKGGWEGVRQKWRAQTLCCLQFISPWIQAANSMKSSCMCRTNVLDGHWLLGFQSVLLQCKCLRWQRKIHGWSEFLHVGSNPVGVRWTQTKGWH